MKKYKIELTEKQMALISESTEMYSRIICGQLEINRFPKLNNILWLKYNKKIF